MGSCGLDPVAYRSAVGRCVASVGGGRSRRFGWRSCHRHPSSSVWIAMFYLFLILRAASLLCHGDVESNPGPAAVADRRAGEDGPSFRPLLTQGAPNLNSSSGQPAGPHADALQIVYFNARSILSKHAEFGDLVASFAASPSSPHIVAISSWKPFSISG